VHVNEHNFDGWLQFPYSHPASPYYGSLVMHFECLSFAPQREARGRALVLGSTGWVPSARAASLLEEPLVRCCSSTAAAVTHRFRLCLRESDAVPLSLIRARQDSPPRWGGSGPGPIGAVT
jgi:hypothetical protein